MSATIYSLDGRSLDRAPPVGGAEEFRRRALHKLGRALSANGYDFAPVSFATQRRVNALPENMRAFDVEAIFGWNRPFSQSLVDPFLFKLMDRAQVVETHHALMRSSVRAVSVHGNLFLHSAEQEERETRVGFGPSEYRFVRALRTTLPRFSRKIRRAAALCCGAGAGALTVSKFQPYAEVFASDTSATAAVFTDINSRIAGTSNVKVVETASLDAEAGSLDLIVANPIWICDDEPRSANFVSQALERLASGGTLMLHAGVAVASGIDRFHLAIEPRLRANGFSWTYEQIDPDISDETLDLPAGAGLDRIAAIWLCATRRT